MTTETKTKIKTQTATQKEMSAIRRIQAIVEGLIDITARDRVLNYVGQTLQAEREDFWRAKCAKDQPNAGHIVATDRAVANFPRS